MRHTCQGTPVPRCLPTCVAEGIEDGRQSPRFEQLYRYPVFKILGYRVGFYVGRVRAKLDEAEAGDG